MEINKTTIFSSKAKYYFLFVLVLLVSGGLLLSPHIRNYNQNFKTDYKQIVVPLVEEKISQGANIVINYPENEKIDETTKPQITFDPEIQGDWVESEKKNKMIFQPAEPLAVGTYYSISVPVAEGKIKKFFEIVDAPEVISFFPNPESETNENSEITLVFNRPMVPLTTLNELESREIPIEISPQTEGKWKWISTRSLQFTPKERLQLSSNYTVKSIANFDSLDGVSVAPFTYEFFTRPLRYQHASSSTLNYNRPISISFNQPVDLERSKAEISVYNKTLEKEIDFIAEYPKPTRNSRTGEEKVNKSTILIYPTEDQFGRKRIWDFTHQYDFEIAKAYPLEGDIILETEKKSSVNVTDIISSLKTTSDRSSHSTVNFFDPEGKVLVSFYEEIDLNASKITGDKISRIEYAQKCAPVEDDLEVGEEVEMNYEEEEECEKIDDKDRIIIKFQADQIGLSEKLNLKFEKIVNIDGLKINPNAIDYTLYSYPKLEVKRVLENNSQSANLYQLRICSSTPLKQPKLEGEEDEKVESIDDYLKVSPEYKFGRWSSSRYISPGQKEYKECQPYEFQTSISYHLIPEKDYEIKLNLKDVFTQITEENVNFRSAKMDKRALNFYSLQDSYVITTPNKTKLTFATENMTYVNMVICEVSALDMLGALNSRLDYEQSAAAQKKCLWRNTKRIDLPEKYWDQNIFQVVLADDLKKELGHYIVTFSHPDYQNYRGTMVHEHTLVSLTNLSVIEKQVQLFENKYTKDQKTELSSEQKSELKNLYWVTDIKSMRNVEAAKIDLYERDEKVNDVKFNLIDSLLTNQDGLSNDQSVVNLAGAIITKGEDSAIIASSKSNFDWASSANNRHKIYVYTDRPIYRPGDKVSLKAIYRKGYDGDFTLQEGEMVNVKVRDSSGKEILNTELEINNYGTVNTDFVIDAGAPLGNYSIRVDNDGWARFDVQEYVPAPFKIETKADQEEYRAGEDFKLDVQADYYFGVPLEGGKISYSILAQDYYFDRYEGEYFQFGSPRYWCWYDCASSDSFILRGETKIDSNGKGKIEHKLDFEKFFDEDEQHKSKIFVVRYTVENTNGQQISGQTSLIVHAGELYLGVKTDDYFIAAKDEFELKIKSVDIQGKEVSTDKIEIVVNQVNWVTLKRKEVDGGYYYRSEKRLKPVQTLKAKTDKKGNWKTKLEIEESGEYEITLQTKDDLGNKIMTTKTIYVYSSNPYYGEQNNSYLRRPTNDTSLEIVNEKPNLAVGDTADFLIKNPFDHPVKALIAIERGKIFDYEIVEIKNSFYKYEFEITEDYIPNVYASVTLISPEPGVKFGKTTYSVNLEEKELDIQVKTDKEKYLPGDTVNLEVWAKDKNGKPVESEVSVAVVDMSVLALKGNPKKNPITFFYNHFPLTIVTSANLKNILYEIDITKGKGGGGGADDNATRKRGVFKDTAWWKADLKTDENGYAQVSFTLPDNLTTWQIESLGVSRDTKLGVNYQEIMTRKNLMLSPLKPRFIIPGDTFTVGAKVFNQTDAKQNLKVSIATDTLTLENITEKTVTLNADESKTVYFDVKAPANKKLGKHQVTLSAKNDEYEDTVEQTIKITRNNTYETVATANYSSDKQTNEYLFLPDEVIPDRGYFKVNVSATLAVFLSDGLNSLISYPYGCAEQIASKLEAIAIVQKGLSLENIGDKFTLDEIVFDGANYTLDEVIERGLARIYESQKSNGGFGYYSEYNWKSDFYLTLRIIQVLANMQEAGVEINETALDKAINHVVSIVRNDQDYQGNANLIYTAHALSKAKTNAVIDQKRIDTRAKQLEEIAALIKSNILANEALLQENMDNLSLTTLAYIMAKNPEIFAEEDKEKVYKILENRIKIDSRGAFLSRSDSYNWRYYETDIKNTALLLQALAADERDNALLGNIVRWLLNARSKDGAWGSTANTLRVVDAFTDYLIWQEENKSDFTLTLSVENKKVKTFDFNADTILSQESHTVAPLDQIGLGKIVPVKFEKKARNDLKNNYYYDAELRYYLPAENIPPRDEGFMIKRNFYDLDDTDFTKPLKKAQVGDVLRGHLEIIVPEGRNFVAVEDYIPAGVELINFSFATEDKGIIDSKSSGVDSDSMEDSTSERKRPTGRKLYPRKVELRDDRLFLMDERVSPGVYYYDYYVRVLIPGEYQHLPAIVSEMYFPENFGRTGGERFVVEE